MRTCREAGRAVISCTLAAVSERHNYVSLLEKMLKEVSQDQLLPYLLPSRGVEVLARLRSPALALFCISSRPASEFAATRLTKFCSSLLAERRSAEDLSQGRTTQGGGDGAWSAPSSKQTAFFKREPLSNTTGAPEPALPRAVRPRGTAGSA